MTDPHDPKGLIREAYRIEGITPEECRSIFLDWALSLPLGADAAAPITALLERHGEPDHPMSRVLVEGLAQAPGPMPRGSGRRGGRAGRFAG